MNQLTFKGCIKGEDDLDQKTQLDHLAEMGLLRPRS
jgi:hypothetical protein